MYHLWNADSIGSVRLRFYALSQSNASKLQSQVLIACSFTIHSVAGIMNFPRYFYFWKFNTFMKLWSTFYRVYWHVFEKLKRKWRTPNTFSCAYDQELRLQVCHSDQWRLNSCPWLSKPDWTSQIAFGGPAPIEHATESKNHHRKHRESKFFLFKENKIVCLLFSLVVSTKKTSGRENK